MIQKVGNRAVHSEGKITNQESLHIVKELHHFSYWFARTYSSETISNQVFSAEFIKQTIHVDVELITQSTKQLKKLQKELDEKDQQAEAKSRVCFATYPTMMNLLSSPPDTRLFGVSLF